WLGKGSRRQYYSDDDRLQPSRGACLKPGSSPDARPAARQGVGLSARPRRPFRRPARAAVAAQALGAHQHRREPGGGPRTRLPAVGQGRLTEQTTNLFGPVAGDLATVESELRQQIQRDPPEVAGPMADLFEAGGKR